MPIVWFSQITALSAHGKGGAFRAFPLRQGLFSASIPIGSPPPFSHRAGADRFPQRTMSGPTHGSAPTVLPGVPSTPGGAGGDGAPPLPVYRGAKRRAAVPRAWPPPAKFRNGIWSVGQGRRPLRGAPQAVPGGGPMYLRHGLRRPNFVLKFGTSVIGIGPYGEKGKPHRPPWPVAQGGERLRRGWEKGVGIAAEIIPEVSSNLGQSLSRGKAATAPFTQGSLALRGMGERADT